MKIVAIFAEKLYAFQYDGEAEDEYFRLMDLWTDNAYLRQYAKDNNIADVRSFVEEIVASTEYIDDLLIKMNKSNQALELFFKPLNDLETGTRVLSLQKGRRYSLRIYAIKIDKNLFVVTGGAIKLVHKMSEHNDTKREKNKLETAKAYLKRNGVSDNDSFYDLINEDYED
jgi:hypothetical protein